MRFGWLTLAHSGSPDEDYAAIHELVTQACLAETVGRDSMRRFGEHVMPTLR